MLQPSYPEATPVQTWQNSCNSAARGGVEKHGAGHPLTGEAQMQF